MKPEHDDPEIPDWTQDSWKEEWENDRLLRERPESLSRIQRNTEEWD